MRPWLKNLKKKNKRGGGINSGSISEVAEGLVGRANGRRGFWEKGVFLSRDEATTTFFELQLLSTCLTYSWAVRGVLSLLKSWWARHGSTHLTEVERVSSKHLTKLHIKTKTEKTCFYFCDWWTNARCCTAHCCCLWERQSRRVCCSHSQNRMACFFSLLSHFLLGCLTSRSYPEAAFLSWYYW